MSAARKSQSEPPATRRSSHMRLPVPCVMLVRVEAEDEPRELRSAAARVKALRVREPVPACERIRILRPHLVVVGRTVGSWAYAELAWAARQVGAEIVDLRHVAPGGAGGTWFADALARAVEGRARRD